MGEFSLVRTILERERIKYTFQVIDPSGKWLGTDTSRMDIYAKMHIPFRILSTSTNGAG